MWKMWREFLNIIYKLHLWLFIKFISRVGVARSGGRRVKTRQANARILPVRIYASLVGTVLSFDLAVSRMTPNGLVHRLPWKFLFCVVSIWLLETLDFWAAVKYFCSYLKICWTSIELDFEWSKVTVTLLLFLMWLTQERSVVIRVIIPSHLN